ncbi:MAG: beta-phosphoglucomutase [Mycoplasmatales bacterium]|nr:beta-phosphoglucomutase [Mycoplasmatales bacterium]
MIKGFIFDLDGVITETAELHYLAWKEQMSLYGIDFTREINTKLKGLSRIETLEGILDAYKIDKFSEKEKKTIAENKNNIYLKKLKKNLSSKDILPGIEKLIINLKDRKIKLAVASSSTNAPLILKKIGLYDYFDYIVNPKKILNGKPFPDIYLKACEGLNLKPSECIGLEDAILGVEGLNKAKIKSIAITHGEKAEWKKANFVVKCTNELILDELLNMS